MFLVDYGLLQIPYPYLQFVFLFISSHEIIPKIINERAPAKAIIPKPYLSLKVNQEKIMKTMIKHENKWLIFFLVSEA